MSYSTLCHYVNTIDISKLVTLIKKKKYQHSPHRCKYYCSLFFCSFPLKRNSTLPSPSKNKNPQHWSLKGPHIQQIAVIKHICKRESFKTIIWAPQSKQPAPAPNFTRKIYLLLSSKNKSLSKHYYLIASQSILYPNYLFFIDLVHTVNTAHKHIHHNVICMYVMYILNTVYNIY